MEVSTIASKTSSTAESVRKGAQWLGHHIVVVSKVAWQYAKEFSKVIAEVAAKVWTVAKPQLERLWVFLLSPLGTSLALVVASALFIKRSHENEDVRRAAHEVLAIGCAVAAGVYLGTAGII